MQQPANPIIYSNFNYYELVVNGQASDHRLPKFSSNDPSLALQLIANARVDDYQWPLLLQGLELSAASAQGGLYQQIVQHMMANRLRFYELPSLRNATAASVSGGKGWCFVPSISNTQHGVDVYQKQSFNTVEKAKAFIDTIPFTAASMAKTLEESGIATSAQNGSAEAAIAAGKDLLANSMASGQTWAYQTECNGGQWRRPKTTEASVDIAPASEPVPLAPDTVKTKKVVLAGIDKSADQAQALIDAAAEGTPFCEECAA